MPRKINSKKTKKIYFNFKTSRGKAYLEDEVLLGDLLGKGQYGSVYRLRETPEYAIKNIEISPVEGMSELSELNYLRSFNHENIIHCNYFLITSSDLGIILPYAPYDLHSYIYNKVIYYYLQVRWAFQLVSAVNFLHSNGFYNCDIKPENVLIINDNAVMADLGFVRPNYVPSDGWCNSYKSPQEQFQADTINFKSSAPDIFKMLASDQCNDYWALGVTIFILLKGKLLDPFQIQVGNVIYKYVTLPQSKLYSFLLKKAEIPEKFCKILYFLLNPDPDIRSLSLKNVLREFSEKFDDREYNKEELGIEFELSNYISGTITEIQIQRPLSHNLDFFIIRGLDYFKVRLQPSNLYVIYNCINLLFRLWTLPILEMYVSKEDMFFETILQLSKKVYKIDIISQVNLELEEAIVIFLDGILLNTKNIFFELPISTAKTEIDKLIKNPYRFFDFLQPIKSTQRTSPTRTSPAQDGSRKRSHSSPLSLSSPLQKPLQKPRKSPSLSVKSHVQQADVQSIIQQPSVRQIPARKSDQDICAIL